MTKRIFHITFLFILTLVVSIQLKAQGLDTLKGASPFTAGHYLPGIWDIRDYSTPAPGFYFIDYNVFLSGEKFFNEDGNQVTGITGPFGRTSLDLDVSGYINIPTFLYASPFKFLGATYMAGVTPAYSTVNSDIAYQRIAQILRDTINQSGTITGKASGFADMTFMPFALSWASDILNLTAAYSLVAPTGRYTPGGSDNVGLGYWTNMFQAFGYIYPMKIKGKPSQAMAIMIAATMEINSKIKDIDVTTGNRFTVEYGISQYLTDRLEIGFMGGNNFQITDDKGSDVWWNPSIHDKMGYVSFQIGGWPIVNKLYTAVKYNVDYGLTQRIKQHLLELNLIYATGWLTGKPKNK
ncbi:MAG: transporter [Bacteroidota bacterium]|nr:transporter [Bacteroidota bacterium]